MSEGIKSESWLYDLIQIYNQLGGISSYSDVYPLAEKIRIERGASWTPQSPATIRRTVEDNSPDSDNFRGRSVFYSVNGLGKGVWGLMPEYLDQSKQQENEGQETAYLEGLEGIIREAIYLRKSRDPKLVETRKKVDNFTCQVCGYRKQVGPDKYIIDVHHLTPLGLLPEVAVTSISDLICLCPNCHRIAHSRRSEPLSLDAIGKILDEK